MADMRRVPKGVHLRRLQLDDYDRTGRDRVLAWGILLFMLLDAG